MIYRSVRNEQAASAPAATSPFPGKSQPAMSMLTEYGPLRSAVASSRRM